MSKSDCEGSRWHYNQDSKTQGANRGSSEELLGRQNEASYFDVLNSPNSMVWLLLLAMGRVTAVARDAEATPKTTQEFDVTELENGSVVVVGGCYR